jgi:uncharacterized protein (DUF2236 family)
VRAQLEEATPAFLFAPDSAIWKINRETALALAAGCAILMQFAHPLVAAGVDEHSEFRSSPLHRYRRTRDLTLALVFGLREEALGAARTINGLHDRVKGRVGEGLYSAKDPELLLWVQATLVYSAVAGYRSFVGPLQEQEANAFYQETKEIGHLLGVPREIYPHDWHAFLAYVADMIDGGSVRVGDRARSLAHQALYPKIPGVPRFIFGPVASLTAGLLPPNLRDQFALPWHARERLTFAGGRLALPLLVRHLPGRLRFHRQARRALNLANGSLDV